MTVLFSNVAKSLRFSPSRITVTTAYWGLRFEGAVAQAFLHQQANAHIRHRPFVSLYREVIVHA
jgi:hypothetical protein